MNREQYKAHFRQRLSEDMDSTTKDKVFGIIVGGAAAGAVGSAVALARANAALAPKTKISTTPSKSSPPQQGVSQSKGVAQRPVTTTPTASTRPVSTPTASTRPVSTPTASTPTAKPIRPYIPVSTPTATTATTPKPTTPTATTPPMFPSDGKAVTIHGGAGPESKGYDMDALAQLKKEHPKAHEMLTDPTNRHAVDFTYPLDHPTHPGVTVKSTKGLDSAGRSPHSTITVTPPKGSSTTNMTGATPHIPAPHVPDVTPPHVTAPKVKGAGVVGLLAAPLIAIGTALFDKKSLAAAGGDAVESAVNNLDPFITTTLGSNDVPADVTPEEQKKDMDAANAQREKQDNDEAEKTKQNALNDTKSGNNSLNKTINDILSGAAKKNI